MISHNFLDLLFLRVRLGIKKLRIGHLEGRHLMPLYFNARWREIVYTNLIVCHLVIISISLYRIYLVKLVDRLLR